MRTILIVWMMCLTQLSWAGTAHLLTSLDLPAQTIKKVEETFYQGMSKSSLNLEIHHRAGPAELYDALTSPDTMAVIWVSHATDERNLGQGVQSSDMIADVFGNDVKHFFTLAPDSLRFLAVVGCNAQSILQGFKDRGHYFHLPGLTVKSFDKKIELFKGLRESLKTAQTSLKRVEQKTLPMLSAEFSIVRHSTSTQQSASWAVMGDRVIGFFPEGSSTQNSVGTIPRLNWSFQQRYNIRHYSDKKNSETPIGELDIHSWDLDGSWKLFTNGQGRPIGGEGQQLYVYKGN